MTEKIGPVQLVAIGFPPDAQFEGRIVDELERLESHETIRILDLLFVGKDAETGDLLALDYQGEEMGAIRDAGGFPLGEGFLTPETLAAVATELLAMSEALEELEAEEAGAGA